MKSSTTKNTSMIFCFQNVTRTDQSNNSKEMEERKVRKRFLEKESKGKVESIPPHSVRKMGIYLISVSNNQFSSPWSRNDKNQPNGHGISQH